MGGRVPLQQSTATVAQGARVPVERGRSGKCRIAHVGTVRWYHSLVPFVGITWSLDQTVVVLSIRAIAVVYFFGGRCDGPLKTHVVVSTQEKTIGDMWREVYKLGKQLEDLSPLASKMALEIKLQLDQLKHDLPSLNKEMYFGKPGVVELLQIHT